MVFEFVCGFVVGIYAIGMCWLATEMRKQKREYEKTLDDEQFRMYKSFKLL